VRANKCLGEEGRKVDHDLSEQRADGSQRHLQLLGQLRLPETAAVWVTMDLSSRVYEQKILLQLRLPQTALQILDVLSIN